MERNDETLASHLKDARFKSYYSLSHMQPHSEGCLWISCFPLPRYPSIHLSMHPVIQLCKLQHVVSRFAD